VIPLVALVAGLVLAVPSAAQVGAGKIGVAARDGIYTMNPDGSAIALIRPEACVTMCPTPRWSPDGSLIAFQEDGLIKVMGSTGGDVRTLASPHDHVFLSPQPWSPSSRELTYGLNSALVVATVDGPVRTLLEDASGVNGAAWSPSGSSIAYATSSGLLKTVAASGGPPTTIASGGVGSWSPDGTRIAFSRTDGIWVVGADGSGLRQIVPDVPGLSRPEWSPDGTKLLFEESDAGNFPLFDAFVVDVSSRQVTALTFDRAKGETSVQPAWSPDGSWITVQRGGAGVVRMLNSDGTCARNIPGPLGEVFWQPLPDAPPLARYRCHQLRVSASTEHAHRTGVELRVEVENTGTEPVTGVRLRNMTGTDFTPTSVRSTSASCSFRRGPGLCRIGSLRPGEKAQVTIRADGRRVTAGVDQEDWPSTTFSARANEPLADVAAASFRFSWNFGSCTTKTSGGGLIEGTSFADVICGRRGRDRIEPSWGKDRVRAGAGDDVIFLRDDSRDVVSCGPGRDLVYADRRDVVGRDCERVRRAR